MFGFNPQGDFFDFFGADRGTAGREGLPTGGRF